MNVLFATGTAEGNHSADRLRDHDVGVEAVRTDALLTQLRNNLTPLRVADAIVLYADSELVRGSYVVRELGALPPLCAMPDGRRWSGLPVLMLVVPRLWCGQAVAPDPNDIEGAVIDVLVDDLIDEVGQYHRRLLGEYESNGFLITVDHGRYRVASALKRRTQEVADLYYAPADRRDRSRTITIHRDVDGVSYEIDLFEALINRADVQERELQMFLEAHPHFLVSVFACKAIARPRLQRSGGRWKEPDFILAPIVAERQLAIQSGISSN